MSVTVGEIAPDFTLPDQHGAPISLSAQVGPVLIVFFPAAFTPVCHDELRALRGISDQVGVLAISCDSPYVLRALDDAEGMGITLLSDFWPHGEVARAFGAFNEQTGTARRVSVLVDAQGRAYARWESTPDRSRDPRAYLQALTALADGVPAENPTV